MADDYAKSVADLYANMQAAGIQPPTAPTGNETVDPANTLAQPTPIGPVAPAKHAPGSTTIPETTVTPSPVQFRLERPAFSAPPRNGVDPGVALGNAGFQSMPSGVGAQIPKPTPPEQQPGAGQVVRYQPTADQGGSPFSFPKPHVVPEHNQMLVAPGIQKSYMTAQDAQNEAIGTAAAAESEQAQGKGMLDAIQANYAAQRGQQIVDTDKANEIEARRLEAEKRLAIDAVKAEPPSEERFWKEKGMATQFAMTLGSALINFGSALHGGDAAAGTKLLHEKIREGVQQQTHAAEINKWKADKMDGVLADFYRLTGDKKQAQDLTYAAGLEMMNKQLDSVAAQSKSDVVTARAAAMKAENEKQQAQILAHWNKWVPAQTVGGGPKIDFKEQARISGALEKAGVPATETTVKEIEDIKRRNGGHHPAASTWNRLMLGIADESEHHPILGGIARMATSNDALAEDAAMTRLAEAQAHAMGQRGTEAIKLNKHTLRGDGSEFALENGLRTTRQTAEERKHNIEQGVDPNQLYAREILEAANRRSKPQPPAAAGTPKGFRKAGE